MAQTIEQKTAGAILDYSVKVTLGGKEYEVAPPTLGTLIMMSAKISELPIYKRTDKITLSEMLADAHDARVVAETVAIMILGAKKLNKKWHLVHFKGSTLKKLTNEILENAMPAELFSATTEILRTMQIEDFFGLTTFLREINLTRATREVVTNQTASGQS